MCKEESSLLGNCWLGNRKSIRSAKPATILFRNTHVHPRNARTKIMLAASCADPWWKSIIIWQSCGHGVQQLPVSKATGYELPDYNQAILQVRRKIADSYLHAIRQGLQVRRQAGESYLKSWRLQIMSDINNDGWRSRYKRHYSVMMCRMSDVDVIHLKSQNKLSLKDSKVLCLADNPHDSTLSQWWTNPIKLATVVEQLEYSVTKASCHIRDTKVAIFFLALTIITGITSCLRLLFEEILSLLLITFMSCLRSDFCHYRHVNPFYLLT